MLDQGARSALIIKTYPTATLARQYEAKVAALPGIAETLQQKTKHKLLGFTYDAANGATELNAARERLVQNCGIVPDNHQPVLLDAYYLADCSLQQPIILQGEQHISGKCLGMIGSTLIVEQNNQQYGLCVSKFTGYSLSLKDTLVANTHQPQQASLF